MKDLHIESKEFKILIKEFKKELSVRDYSQSYQTRNYVQTREFLFFCESRQIDQVEHIAAQDILDYHEYISTRPNQTKSGTLSDSMIASHIGCVKKFMEFLEECDLIDASPIQFPSFQKIKQKQRAVATKDEIKMIYAVTKDSRERAVLSLAYGCGLRRSEIVNLNISDVMLYKGILVVRNGKNSKSRRVPMSDKVIQDLKKYLFERQRYIRSLVRQSESFLIGEYGSRLTGQSIYNMFKSIVSRTQNLAIFKKKLCLHSLRHSIATHLLENGATIEFVQRFLGHSSIDMAHHYSKRRKQNMKIKSMAEKYYNPNNHLSYE